MSGTDPWKTAFRSPCFFGPPGTLFRPPRRAGTDTGTDLGKGFFLYARFFLPFCLFFAFLGFYLYVTAFPLCFTAFLPLVSGRILGKNCKIAVLWYPPGLFWLYFRPFSLSRPRHVVAETLRLRLSESLPIAVCALTTSSSDYFRFLCFFFALFSYFSSVFSFSTLFNGLRGYPRDRFRPFGIRTLTGNGRLSSPFTKDGFSEIPSIVDIIGLPVRFLLPFWLFASLFPFSPLGYDL